MNGIDFIDSDLSLSLKHEFIDDRVYYTKTTENVPEPSNSRQEIFNIGNKYAKAIRNIYDKEANCLFTIKYDYFGCDMDDSCNYIVNISVVNGHVEDIYLNNHELSAKSFFKTDLHDDERIMSIEDSLDQYVDCYKSTGHVVDENSYTVGISIADEKVQGLYLDGKKFIFHQTKNMV